ncbi:hypothetical protein D3C76_714440 [compost metagenome]
MSREVAQHPAAAMEEHEHRQLTLDLGRAHDLQGDRLAIDLNAALRDFNAGQIDLDRGLGAGQYRTGVFRAELFEGLAAALLQRFEKRLGVLFDTRAAGGERAGHGEGEEAGGEGLVDNVHARILFYAKGWSRRLAWPEGPSLRLVRRLSSCSCEKKRV